MTESGDPFDSLTLDEDSPVRWDPCRPIDLVVNPRAAPEGGDQLLREAVEEISAATGLQFRIGDWTEELPSKERSPVQADVYGDRWAPVIVAWTDPDELAGLTGDVAGLGGGQPVSTRGSPLVYVTGGVFLDGPQLSQVLERPDGAAEVRAVIARELGHLVGLDHVTDPTQLMAPEAGDVVHFASGDLAGLGELGRGPCVPRL